MCNICDGTGYCNYCEYGYIECKFCYSGYYWNGDEYEKCLVCNGNYREKCWWCDGSFFNECLACRGNVIETCSSCNGSGKK